ncbi:MAG: flagellar FliJ family protein [Peptococcaceae bacterium]|nr:flagellar FliJ family protein [Peptococcaceae bacterium]
MMARFVFRLEPVLQERALREELAQQKLAEALREKHRQQELLEGVRRKLLQTLNAPGVTGTDVCNLIHHSIFREVLSYQEKTLVQEVRQKEAVVVERQQEVTRARREKKKFEKLKERRYQEYLKEVRRQEAKILDDITCRRYPKRD